MEGTRNEFQLDIFVSCMTGQFVKTNSKQAVQVTGGSNRATLIMSGPLSQINTHWSPE